MRDYCVFSYLLLRVTDSRAGSSSTEFLSFASSNSINLTGLLLVLLCLVELKCCCHQLFQMEDENGICFNE